MKKKSCFKISDCILKDSAMNFARSSAPASIVYVYRYRPVTMALIRCGFMPAHCAAILKSSAFPVCECNCSYHYRGDFARCLHFHRSQISDHIVSISIWDFQWQIYCLIESKTGNLKTSANFHSTFRVLSPVDYIHVSNCGKQPFVILSNPSNRYL